jgi:hypothetical protein
MIRFIVEMFGFREKLIKARLVDGPGGMCPARPGRTVHHDGQVFVIFHTCAIYQTPLPSAVGHTADEPPAGW